MFNVEETGLNSLYNMCIYVHAFLKTEVDK